MSAFEDAVAYMEKQHAAVNKCESLKGQQAACIWRTQIDGYSHVGEILRDGIADEIHDHAAWVRGLELWNAGDVQIAKMHFEDAEICVTAEYAYQIYLAVKAVIDKGSDLT